MILDLLSAGAAQGLVRALQSRFNVLTGGDVRGTFSAVGAIRERFLAQEPCDVLILTEPMLRTFADEGRLERDTVRPLGRVRTGVAVRANDAAPPIGDADALRTALLAADSIYFPDPERATAGIHFVNVLRRLGIAERVVEALRPFPNGATAMRELAQATTAHPIGCTQVTEIRYTDGVELVGVLPSEFELSTVYAAGVSTTAKDRALARRFIELITGDDTRALREDGGFEPM
jgi:molybdate transport system substrate-binding protein